MNKVLEGMARAAWEVDHDGYGPSVGAFDKLDAGDKLAQQEEQQAALRAAAGGGE